ncbi:hypothetical protein [Streptosporangium amethystogenes]|uniref:hypothetical protein n=1 Tax=Streptosporangium amethystogenes TaxID=2002 RepID=UPI0012FA0616|nr:hypothetical protein [Streptosporangium amethystogenes]
MLEKQQLPMSHGGGVNQAAQRALHTGRRRDEDGHVADGEPLPARDHQDPDQPAAGDERRRDQAVE